MMGGHSLDHAIGAKQLPRTWRRAAVDQAPLHRRITANCDGELVVLRAQLRPTSGRRFRSSSCRSSACTWASSSCATTRTATTSMSRCGPQHTTHPHPPALTALYHGSFLVPLTRADRRAAARSSTPLSRSATSRCRGPSPADPTATSSTTSAAPRTRPPRLLRRSRHASIPRCHQTRGPGMPSWCVLGGRCSALESRSLAPRVRRALVPNAGRAIDASRARRRECAASDRRAWENDRQRNLREIEIFFRYRSYFCP